MRRQSILILLVVVALLALPAVAGAEPATPPAAAGMGGGVWHMVKYGQTLTIIARMYSVSPSAIAAVNGLVSIHAIYAGSWLWIPRIDAPQGPLPVPTCRTKYTVRRGDTLASIGRRFGESVSNLARNNDITNVNRIWPGQRLCIPAWSGPAA